MSNITINVDFLAGTDIREAIAEAKDFAIKLDIAYVSFNFNGVSCSIGQTADVNNAAKSVMKAMSEDKMKFVVAN